jgi:hypothetical protein
MNQEGKTDQEIGDDDSEDAGESTFSSDIEEPDLEHPQEVLHLGQARRDKALQPTRVPLRKTRSRADTVIARPPLPNTRNLPAAIATARLKHEKSSLVKKLSESDHAPSALALLLPNKSSGDLNSPQPKASSD